MRSTNFEFLRKHRPDLADEAAAIERELYDSPGSAIDLLRTFGQRLLQHFLEATGQPIRNRQGKTFGFDDLLQQPIPQDRRKQFHELRVEGNKQHEPRHEPTRDDVRRLLQTAWILAGWVGEQLSWQDIPTKFISPPEGGRELDEMRRQRNEALKLVADAKRSCDVNGWICADQRNITAPADFVGRDFVFDEIKQFLASADRRVLLIQGQPGRGKTAIIQRFLGEELPAGISPFVFYFRDQESQAEPQRWVRHFYASLVKRFELPSPKPTILEAKPEDLVQHLRNRVEEATKKHPGKRLLFVIDGVDEAGSAEKLVWSFLNGMFPDVVQVIATTRRIHRYRSPKLTGKRSSGRLLDLDASDYRNNHRDDGREYVLATMPELDCSTIDRVVQLSDANFLILQGVCRELREADVPEVALSELSALKSLGKNLVSELYDRTWKRLERMPAENLDRVEKLAAILVNAPESFSERMIKEILKLRRADWVNVQQCFAEYLDQSHRYPPGSETPFDNSDSQGLVEDSEPIFVFRLFHQTFVEFLRRELQDDLAEANTRLADYCQEQIGKRKTSYEYEYAVRFGPEHLCRAEKWTDLEELLTNLEFVEEKCRLGMVPRLIADYQLASQQHPAWRRTFRDEFKREESLTSWAEKTMKAGRNWRILLDRKWFSDDPDSIQLPKPYPFPPPPDTSKLRAQLLKAKQDRKQPSNKAVATLRALRSFVTQRADLLSNHSESVLPAAFNYNHALADQAERLLTERGHPWFAELPRPYVDPNAIALPTLKVHATAFAVSDDGTRCVTGEVNGDLRFWDLTTGECVAHERSHASEVTRVLLSVDGGRVISIHQNGSIEAWNFHDQRMLWHKSYAELADSTAASCSLEASIVATVGTDDVVRVIDADIGDLLCELHAPEVQGITSVHVVPERFEILVVYDESNLAWWDLETVVRSASEPNESQERELPEDETLEQDGDELVDFWNRGWESADQRVSIWDERIHVDGKVVREFGILGNGGLHLVADGRVLWTNTTEFCDHHHNPNSTTGSDCIRAWDVLSHGSCEDIETIDHPRVVSSPNQTIRVDSEANETTLLSYRAHSMRIASWITADGQIGIAADAEDHGPVLHSIRVPSVPGRIDELKFRLSLDGRYALVSLHPTEDPASWFLWDIPSGKKVSASTSRYSAVFDVLPDWRSIVVIAGGILHVRDLQTGASLRSLPVLGNASLSPDGRKLAVCSDHGVSVWDISPLQPDEILHCPGARQALFSPDAKFLVCSSADRAQLYDLRPGQRSGDILLDQPCHNALSERPGAYVDGDGTVIVDADGATAYHISIGDIEFTQVHLKLRNLPELTENLEPLVTATRVFRYRLDDPVLQDLLANCKPLPAGYEIPGAFDNELTVVCPTCGNQFNVPHDVKNVIERLSRDAGLMPEESPCLHLPDSAWSDPALLCECTHCQKPLRLNPFVT